MKRRVFGFKGKNVGNLTDKINEFAEKHPNYKMVSIGYAINDPANTSEREALVIFESD